MTRRHVVAAGLVAGVTALAVLAAASGQGTNHVAKATADAGIERAATVEPEPTLKAR